jgi:hypothetical protein
MLEPTIISMELFLVRVYKDTLIRLPTSLTYQQVVISAVIKEFNQDAPIKFTINAKNLPIYGATCDVNKAALIYAVISTDCVTSPIGYFYDNNTCTQKYCNAYLPGCTNCLSTTTCSSCRSTGNWQLVSAVCQCIEPYVSMHGCRDCITAGGSCASCDSTLQFKLDTSTGKCVCKDGYALDSNKFCIQCQSPNVMMIGCLYCVASGSACPQCSF